MIDEALVEKAHAHVRRWFARHMPPHLLFHDLEHTLSVTRTAVQIGQAVGLDAKEIALLEIAALFHDSGYAKANEGHEAHSADLAERFLQRHGVAQRHIARIRGLILATRVGQRPRSLLQQVLRDADSAKAGQADFLERGERLRQELVGSTGGSISPEEWCGVNLAYLRAHRFHTRYAQQRYGRQKALNLAALRGGATQPPGAGKTGIPDDRFIERDLSWLSFNDRVLQEAKDPRVPLLERIKFLAIYSSNLDEFYRVRVASLRSLSKLTKAERAALEVPTAKLIGRLNRKALKQQQEFGRLYRETLLPALAAEGIRILQPQDLTPEQARSVRKHFKDKVAPVISTAAVRPGNAPFIEDRKLYYVCRLRQKGRQKQRLILVNIPSDELGRFVTLPAPKGQVDVMFLDDVMRMGLTSLFASHKLVGCHAIKLSRDAELYLDEEFAGNMKEKVRRSLRKRQTGVPSRFLYDGAMPAATLRQLRALLGLDKQDLVTGGRYHNFSDLMKLPVEGHAHLRDPDMPALRHPALKGRDTFKAIAVQDVLMHFPYHDFGQLTQWLAQAARDPAVMRIAITLYRVAEGSAVCGTLMDALERGKQVTAFVEVKARFDERSNLFWGETLERAGAEVLYSYEHLKVHCKLCLIERREGGRIRRYAYLGTGNFNERTSRIYSDSALLTAKPALTAEVAAVFEHLRDRRKRPELKHLWMAPVGLRASIEQHIDREIEEAIRGRPAEILVKLNSLEDRTMVRKLYDAARAGVRVRLIIRGICCLVPGSGGTGDRIEAISIVDRYLEHARVYVFHAKGRPVVYLSSADWMGRNMDRRIEVAFPLLDAALRNEMLEILDLQWRDRVKARVIDARQTNPYLLPAAGEEALRSQTATYAYLARKAKAGS